MVLSTDAELNENWRDGPHIKRDEGSSRLCRSPQNAFIGLADELAFLPAVYANSIF